MADSEERLQRNLRIYQEKLEKISMKINIKIYQQKKKQKLKYTESYQTK